MLPEREPASLEDAERSDTLRYLHRRVREEADAAARATSMDATLIHVILATAYAKRFGERSGASANPAGHSWADQHRIW